MPSAKANHNYTKGHTEAGIDFEFNTTDKKALMWLYEKDVKQFWIGESYTPELNENLNKITSEVLKAGLGRSEAAQLFKTKLVTQFKKTDSYWELMSEHIVTRSREFGRVSAYEKAGVEYIKIAAIIDRRTSNICRELNGRIIEVSKVVGQRSKLLKATSVEEVKKIAPWYNEKQIRTKIKDKPTKKLPGGVGLPPYHAFCRTTTVIWLEHDNNVDKFEFGEIVKDKKKVESYSPAEYSNLIYDIKGKAKAAGLKYSEYDLANDKKHRVKFGLNEKEFISKANRIIKEADNILIHTFSAYDKSEKKPLPKEMQFLYFGNDGYVVVDKNFEIKGCYPHLKKTE